MRQPEACMGRPGRPVGYCRLERVLTGELEQELRSRQVNVAGSQRRYSLLRFFLAKGAQQGATMCSSAERLGLVTSRYEGLAVSARRSVSVDGPCTCSRKRRSTHRAAAVVAPVRATWACVAPHSTPTRRFSTSTSRVAHSALPRDRELSDGSGAIFTCRDLWLEKLDSLGADSAMMLVDPVKKHLHPARGHLRCA